MADTKPKRQRQKRTKVVLTAEQQLKAEQKLAKRKAESPDTYLLPESKRSIEDLANYFSAASTETKRILPIEKRRYIIYLRKSTDDESKQVRSLEDQRAECQELVLFSPTPVFFTYFTIMYFSKLNSLIKN